MELERVGRAHYLPGDVIFRQGDPGELFYVITEGEVEVMREESDGSQTPLTHLRRLDRAQPFGRGTLWNCAEMVLDAS